MNEVKTVEELIEKLDLVILGSQGLSLNGEATLNDYGRGCLDMAMRVRASLREIKRKKERHKAPHEVKLES